MPQTFERARHIIKKFTLTTPSAILLGAVIIGGSIVAYGHITSGTSNTPKVRDYIAESAKELKLKGSKWEACLADPEMQMMVDKDYNDGLMAGVDGTPTTFVLVKQGESYGVVSSIIGAQPESLVRAAIDEALSGNAKTTPFNGSPLLESEYTQGTGSNVVVIEYSDPECPFCMKFQPTITSVMDDYKDKVTFAYRHFPLSSIHPNANRYAVAIDCAGKMKGKEAYFAFINTILSKQAEQ